MALGRDLSRQIRQSTTPVASAVVQDYVAQLGVKLSAQMPGGGPFTFPVVNGLSNPMHEPIALPDGEIFVPLSLLLAANDEAEFAGVLAQAMAREPLRINPNAAAMPVVYAGSLSGDSTIFPPRSAEIAARHRASSRRIGRDDDVRRWV